MGKGKVRKSRISEPGKLLKKINNLQKSLVKQKSIIQNLKEKSDDYKLISRLNISINKGASLAQILNQLALGTKKLFRGYGVNIYLPSEDGKFLILQRNKELNKRIEQIVRHFRIKLPDPIVIEINKSNIHKKIIESRTPRIIRDPQQIAKIIAGFVGNGSIKNKIPKITKYLNIRAVIYIPLIIEGKLLGLMDLSLFYHITINFKKRMEAIASAVNSILKYAITNKQLRHSQQELQMCFNCASDIILWINADGVIERINDRVKDILDREPDELIGTNISKLTQIFDQDMELLFRRFKEVTSRGKMKTGQKKNLNITHMALKKRTGQIVHIEARTSAIKESGKILGYLSIVRDITEQKIMENTLRTSEDLLRNFMESANEGFAMFDREFNVIEANQYVLDKFGLKKEDIIGKNMLDYSLGAIESGRFQMYQRVIDSGKPVTVEVTTPDYLGSHRLTLKVFRLSNGIGMLVHFKNSSTETEKEIPE